MLTRFIRRVLRSAGGRRLLRLAMLGAVLLMITSPRPAQAHAELARAEPAPNTSLAASPSAIRLWFTEEIEPSFTEAQVLDKDGRRMNAESSRADPGDRRALTVSVSELPQGTYTVVWRALSAVDGHVTRGSFAFGVGVPVNLAPPDPYALQQPQAPAVAVRWLNFTASTAVAGVFPFLLWVWLPAVGRLRSDSARSAAVRRALRRAWLFAGWGLAALTLASVGLLIVQAASLYDGDLGAAFNPATLAQVVWGTRNGTVFLVRMGLIAGLAALVYQLVRVPQRGPTRGQLTVGMALGGAVLFTSSLTGHAGAVGRAPLVNVVVDWLHLIGAAVWVGGLLHLAGQLPLLSHIDRRDRTQVIVAAIPRFSTAALISFAVLVATGLYSSVINIPDVQALQDTIYGNALAAKLQFMLVLGLIGLTNLFLVRRQFVAFARGGERGADPSFRFWSLVAVEAGLGLLILLAVGVMTSIMPARQAVSLPGMRPLEVSASVDDLRVQLRVSPYEAGNNEIAVGLRDANGAPAEADRVTVRFTMREHDMGVQEAVLTPTNATGRYSTQGSYLSMAGTWTAEVHVRRAGRDDAVVPFTFPVLDVAPGKLAAYDVPDAASLGNGPLVAGQLAVLGLVLSLAALRFGGAATRTGLVSLGLSGVFLLLAGFVGGSIQLEATPTLAAQTPAALLQNPVPADARSVETGAGLYAQNCLVCHGARGRGDGPAAATLRPRPVDLTVHVTQHPEGVLFTWISDGVPGSAMPAFRDRLTDEERWHILNYLKTLAVPVDR